mgnify:CR=1 FL=1|jgi:hypothetical protein
MNAKQITTRAPQAPIAWDLGGVPDDWAVFPRRGAARGGAR